MRKIDGAYFCLQNFDSHIETITIPIRVFIEQALAISTEQINFEDF